MTQTLLTVDKITSEALVILHQKLNFIGNINRQYDNQFAQSGAKIGDTLRIRLPNQYTVRTGKTIQVQDTEESKVDLTLATQKGVDMEFSAAELTMEMDDFSTRIIEPAMSVLAADLEANALTMYKDVWNQVDGSGSAGTWKQVLEVRKQLVDNLAPAGNWCYTMDTQLNVDILDATKGLFQDSSQIASQYREGLVGRTAGFNFFENTLLPTHTHGAENGSYITNGAGVDGAATLAVDTGTGTILEGDTFTCAGCYRVHPETKVSTGILQKFVVTADSAGGGVTLEISPTIVASGAKQNVSNVPGDGVAVTFDGTASGTDYMSLAFQKDAFAFVTADLVKPDGVDFCSRQVQDGISMRIVRDYDINNDNFPCRIDVLHGYKAIRPQLACRHLTN